MMILYRYETRPDYDYKTVINTIDGLSSYAARPFSVLIKFSVVSETPCGYWFVYNWEKNYPECYIKQHRRWVSNSSRKRFCYPTKEEAWNSYEIRRAKRLSYLERDFGMAKAAMALRIEDAVGD